MARDLASMADLFRVLGDPSRMRILSLLGEEEITVAEITRATGLAQSRVSTHLGRLKEAGLVKDRREGACAYYSMVDAGMAEEVARARALLRDGARDPLLDEDRKRLARVLAARGRGESWADSVAGKMDRQYSPGRTWEATAWGVLGLARLGDVIDVASGDGVLAELIAPRARSVTCVDSSRRVTEAGRRRLAHLRNVAFHQGDMHSLPFGAGRFQQALLMNALTYSDDPSGVFREIARVLEPGGTLVGVTLLQHEQSVVRARYDHVRLGFLPGELREMLERTGFAVELCDVTSRERRRPHFEVITIHARRAGAAEGESGTR
ncbi:MAG: metalloregulator ArsR/SmtB family transcription factor [Planctomycetes bacterium]|nr:metalloregulator ArsR/SmtB family transcription factor [Planctomycetota bacterium]